MNGPSHEDKQAIAWTIFFLAVVSAIVLLAGCGEARPPVDQAPAVTTLGSLGATLVWAGGISAAAGIALRLISLVYPPLAGFGAFFGLLGVGGFGIIAVGSSIQWLSDNPIVMVAAILVSIGAVVWWYWPRIRRALDRRLVGKV
jgi:hypothetical protein